MFHVERAAPEGDEPPPMTLESQLATLAEALRESPHNLMSDRALEALESRHFPEALALTRLLPDGPADLLDVGSGGGIPGLVIAAARPDLGVTLVEATGKKARFLAATVRTLDLDVDVVRGRVEGEEVLRQRFDLATARAVAPLATLATWVLPCLRPGGRLYAVKGSRWREDLDSAREAIADAGGRVVATPPDPRACTDSVDPPLRVVIIAA